jgi:hypothetical protein
MRWIKRGLLIPGPAPVPWESTHAMVPVAEVLDDGAVRIYFTTRDAAGRSEVASATLDFPDGVLAYSQRPHLSYGELGAFDDAGAMTGSLVRDGDRRWLYYIGWTRGVSVPFYTFIGCAVSEDGGQTFTRVSPAPVLERAQTDPYITTSPWVIREDGRWRMWYVSGTGWRQEGARAKHWYHIRYAESSDGIRWTRNGQICIDYADAHEYAISRPCVIRDRDAYRMWYSRRGDAYRIGYAESADGVNWIRKDDEVGIDVGPDAWDADMIEYPFVFDHGGRRYLLYNGNRYGATGIGWAELEE